MTRDVEKKSFLSQWNCELEVKVVLTSLPHSCWLIWTSRVMCVFVYLPLCERRQDVCVHVWLVDDRLSSDRTLLSRAASTRTGLHRLRTTNTNITQRTWNPAVNMKPDWWNQKRCWADVTHHSVALLGLQVFFIHLVEFVEHSGHNRKTPLLSSLQDWGRDGQLSFTSHSQVLMSVFTSYSSCDLFICYFILFLDVFWSDWTFLTLNITERLYRSPEEELLNSLVLQ